MSTIDRIVPVLARTVMAVAIITSIGAGSAAYLFSEVRLVAFAAFAVLAGAYAWKVVHSAPRPVADGLDLEQNIHPLAA